MWKGTRWVGVGLAWLLVLPAATGWAESPLGARRGEAIETAPDGSVNWGAGVVTAKGLGVPPPTAVSLAQAQALAVEAAEVLARRNLLALIKGVAIDSLRTVETAMIASSVTQERVSGFVRGAQVVETREFSDGRVEVTVAMRLTGEFADLVLPRPLAPSPTGAVTPPPAPQPSATTPERPPVIYTGLVVDARGLGVRPAIAPKIVSEAGQEIYGSAIVDRTWAVKEGMAGYSKDLIAAQANERVTDRPLTIKGVKADGPNRSDIVIRSADAQVLLGVAAHLSFLEKARVMIVVD